MTTLAILYLLAVIDGIFVGYRDAAGRNPLLDKRKYYLRAVLKGVGLAHLAMVVIAIVVMSTLWMATETSAVVGSLEEIAAILKVIYLGYTACVAFTFCVYALPSYDLRSYVSIAVFGLLTLVRPIVIVIGVVVAAVVVNDPATWPTCLAIIATMGGLQPLLYELGWNRFDATDYIADAATDGST